jgi:uncharacterized protein YecT (DUF1311 family)
MASVTQRASALAVTIAALAWMCPVAQAGVTRPTLPTTAPPNTLGSFRCPSKPISTLDIESCEAHKQLALAREFNKLTASLWPLLDATGRQNFASAHRAWLKYSDQECAVDAREALGGTAAGVIFATCKTTATRARIKEVAAILRDYCQGHVRTGPYRRCPRS